VPHRLYSWDDKRDNNFTRNRARLDEELGKQTEFPKDMPEKRHRMNPAKLAKRRELFLAVRTLLQDSELPSRCRNVSAAQKYLERLHQDHFDRLNQLRREMNLQNPIFPLAFALTSKGRSMDSPEGVWEAVISCTTHTGRVEFVDPPRRGRTVTPVAQTALTDIPPHASVHFKRNDKLSKFQRAKIANTILELCAYSLCLPLEHGTTIHHDRTCSNPSWLNINILWLMGHEFDEMTREQINQRSHQLQNMWRNGLLISHQTSFSNTNHFLRGYPELYTSQWQYCQDVSSFSDDIRTVRDSDDEDVPPS
jgi:hypothetical protein